MLLDDRGGELTFRQYRERAEGVAAALHQRGIGSDSVVSWQLPTTLDAAVLLAALARLDAVQNPIVPILRDREVRYIARESRCELLVVRPTWRGFCYEAMANDIAGEIGFGVLAAEALPTGDATALPTVAQEGTRKRWLYYTSGTSSDPKGVWHTDESVTAGSDAWVHHLGLTADDVFPVATPIAHIGGACLLTASLRTGARLQLIEHFDVERSPYAMAGAGATVLGSALPQIRAYVAAQRAHGDEPLFPKLRACVNGGAPKPEALHDEVKAVLGGAGLISCWGLTEYPSATLGRPDDTAESLAKTEGTAAPGVEIRVVDCSGDELTAGEEGELRLRGPALFVGYANPELDKVAFDDEGFFCTGDLGVVSPSGHVKITGRSKDIVIRNAENISAQEIEDVLIQHSAIADVAVISLPDPLTGERACAIVKLTADTPSLTLASVNEHCRAFGLATQKFPEQLEIVDELPRNSLGKLDKTTLRKRFLVH